MRQEQVKPSFILSEREAIRAALHWTVLDLKRYMSSDPEEYTEHGCDEPSIDIRLCVDADGWIIRTGDSSFDPYHSSVCVDSCVTPDTDTDELLNDLIEQSVDQAAMSMEVKP